MQGQLTVTEMEDRQSKALRAVTCGDLTATLADLDTPGAADDVLGSRQQQEPSTEAAAMDRLLSNSTLNLSWACMCVLTVVTARLLRCIPMPRDSPPLEQFGLCFLVWGGLVIALISWLKRRYVFLVVMVLTGYVALRLALG